MEQIYSQFRLDGRVIHCTRTGGGHINRTYLVVTAHPHLYILQWINGSIFKNLVGLMNNVVAVTDYLHARLDDPRRALKLVPTVNGEPYLLTEEGDCWRVYEYITDSVCLDAAESAEDLRQSGVAFGMFQNQLADFPAATLTETIPHFHDTPDRYRNKAQYPVTTGKKGVCAGFFRAGTHQVVENDRCLILPRETDEVKNIVIDFLFQRILKKRTAPPRQFCSFTRTERKGVIAPYHCRVTGVEQIQSILRNDECIAVITVDIAHEH